MSEEFYLCQPESRTGFGVSCASCCGIYNYRGHHRGLVSEILEIQTALFSGWEGTAEAADRIVKEVERRRPAARFEVIYNCPFTGFLDAERTRVGCLLHPGHAGRDLRDFCRYGHRTCGEARCTAYTYLSEEEKAAVIAASGDWYLYGLCITDLDLVKDFFELCEMRLYQPVDPGRAAREPELRRLFHDYLRLKEEWPWATDPGRFGKYYFVGRDYHVYLINYQKLGLSCPHHDGILLALGSVIETQKELTAALQIIDEKVEAFVRAYSRSPEESKAGVSAGSALPT